MSCPFIPVLSTPLHYQTLPHFSKFSHYQIFSRYFIFSYSHKYFTNKYKTLSHYSSTKQEGTAESIMCDVIKKRIKRKMRVEVGKETPKKEMYNRCIFMTSHMTHSLHKKTSCMDKLTH